MRTREVYMEQRRKLNRLPLKELEDMLKVLSYMRYDLNDISVENEHRLASSVYLQRTRTGDSLIFHLKNYVK